LGGGVYLRVPARGPCPRCSAWEKTDRVVVAVQGAPLLTQILNLLRERGGDSRAAVILMELCSVNQSTGCHKEGTQQAREASEISKRLGDTVTQAECLIRLASLLCLDNQLDAAEEAVFHALDLLPEEGHQFRVCEFHRALGNIYQSKGYIEKAVRHFEVAIGIATPFDWHDVLFWLHYELARLFLHQTRFDDAHAHIGHAKSHTANSAYFLGAAVELQAAVWYDQHRLEEARSTALRATDFFEKLGAAKDLERCRRLLWDIEKGMNIPVASGRLD